jgi:hypothetical protein
LSEKDALYLILILVVSILCIVCFWIWMFKSLRRS